MLEVVVKCCLMLHGVAWCCMVLHGVAWCCMVLYGVVWCCIVLHGVARYCLVLQYELVAELFQEEQKDSKSRQKVTKSSSIQPNNKLAKQHAKTVGSQVKPPGLLLSIVIIILNHYYSQFVQLFYKISNSLISYNNNILFIICIKYKFSF